MWGLTTSIEEGTTITSSPNKCTMPRKGSAGIGAKGLEYRECCRLTSSGQVDELRQGLAGAHVGPLEAQAERLQGISSPTGAARLRSGVAPSQDGTPRHATEGSFARWTSPGERSPSVVVSASGSWQSPAGLSHLGDDHGPQAAPLPPRPDGPPAATPMESFTTGTTSDGALP
jgi:hypothetical protein